MSSFDLSLYYPIPALDTEGLGALAKVLLGNRPEPSTPTIEQTAERLAAALAATEQALVDRIEQELGHRRLRVFDLFTGIVWDELDSRLSAHAIYLHEAVDQLDEADRELLDVDARTDLARRAAKVHAKLFGEGKLFLRSPYPQQAMQMAARLRWVASKADEFDLAELVGAELVTLLDRCQVRYEALVDERSHDTGRVVSDLRELRSTLSRCLSSYIAAVGATADEANLASIARVEQALRPVLVARAHARRGRAGTPEQLDAVPERGHVGDAAIGELVVDELTADELVAIEPAE